MYQKMYTTLFNAVTGALELMEAHKFDAARLKLMSAQQEELYISAEPPAAFHP